MKNKIKKHKIQDSTEDLISGLLDLIDSETQSKIDYRMALAAKIYTGMKAKGWNQTTFAEMIRKDTSVISKWLSGTHNFETDTLHDIQKILEINLLDLQQNETECTFAMQPALVSKSIGNIIIGHRIHYEQDSSIWDDASLPRVLKINKGQHMLKELKAV